MRPLLAIGLALALVGVTYAQPKPQELILGKWRATEKQDGKELKITLEFLKDGKMSAKIEFEGASFGVNGTYKVIDAENLEVTVEGNTQKSKMKLTEKELTTTDPQGKTTKFTKLKPGDL
jgi:uncharacterized protein (TIGR03066 family)